MDPQKRSSNESNQSSGPKEFKTMEIQTKGVGQTPFNPIYQQTPSYYNQMYGPIVMLIMSFWQNESNKKFYKNDVLNINMAQLLNYSDINKIKAHFPSCATFNNSNLDFNALSRAEFFILRSTCDDDIHKAIKYGLWTSTNYTNHILNNRFKECSKLNIPLFLIFT